MRDATAIAGDNRFPGERVVDDPDELAWALVEDMQAREHNPITGMASRENDGLLTASKVATLKLDADWLVLSACNTAEADGTPDASGLSGLAKAFFYEGARSILVSHWSIASKATVKLITGTFAELKNSPKIGRAEALRRAEMAMLDPENPPEFAHPMIWAPFVLAGEGGAGRWGPPICRIIP